MITKDGRDTPIEKLTAENYIVPKGEEKSYHVVIENKQFDPKTGKRLSIPRIQKFGKKIFETHVFNSLRKQGFDIVILHDPNEWIKAQSEKAAKAKAEQEKRVADEMAEKEKKVADEMAELRAKLAEQEKQIAELKGQSNPEGNTEVEPGGKPEGDTEGEKEPGKPGRPKSK